MTDSAQDGVGTTPLETENKTQTHIGSSDNTFFEIFEQVKNAPGSNFAAFNAAAVLIAPEYRKLNQQERGKIYQKVQRERAEAQHEDDNISTLEYWLDAENGVKFTDGNL